MAQQFHSKIYAHINAYIYPAIDMYKNFIAAEFVVASNGK